MCPPSHGVRPHPTPLGSLSAPSACSPTSQQPVRLWLESAVLLVPHNILAIPAARTLASGLGCPQYSEGAPQSTRAQYLHPVRPSAYMLQSASLHHKSSPPHPIQLSTSYPALHTSYPALCSGVAVGRDQARVLGGTRAARRLRAARRRRIDLAGCANDGRQPRGLVRLLVARARPVRQHGQSARTRGHCGARMPAQSLSRGLPEVSGPGFDHADRAPAPLINLLNLLTY